VAIKGTTLLLLNQCQKIGQMGRTHRTEQINDQLGLHMAFASMN
jgi:hypothetical protein